MPAPAYTKDEAAVHELGHAAVACALGLDILELVLYTAPAGGPAGWYGHCRPGPAFPAEDHWVLQDAFALGGIITQIVQIPASIAPHEALVQPSLFSNTSALFDKGGAIPNHLHWTDDLIDTQILYVAPGAPNKLISEGRYGARPWLADMEVRIRALVGTAEVRAFVNATRPLLEQSNLPGNQVQTAFNHHVPAAICQPLATFLGQQPDDDPPNVLLARAQGRRPPRPAPAAPNPPAAGNAGP